MKYIADEMHRSTINFGSHTVKGKVVLIHFGYPMLC